MSDATTSIDPSVAVGWLAAIDRSHFLLELDPGGSILHANVRLCAALGYEECELVGRRHRELIASGTHANASAGEPHRTLIYRARDGSEVVVRASITAIPGDDERTHRSLLVGIDVSDRRELRAALDRQRQGPDRPERSQDTGHAMPDLLEYLSGASRGETILGAVAIADRVGECADLMRPAAEAKGLALRCAIDPDLPALIDCDPLRLRRVLLHLIGNAVRFTEAGWISICAEPAWEDPATLAISVTDTGGGIATAEAAGGSPGAEQDGASGSCVGLAVSAETARQMGGVLTLTSERGRGTRAELRLPLRRVGLSGDRKFGEFRIHG